MDIANHLTNGFIFGNGSYCASSATSKGSELSRLGSSAMSETHAVQSINRNNVGGHPARAVDSSFQNARLACSGGPLGSSKPISRRVGRHSSRVWLPGQTIFILLSMVAAALVVACGFHLTFRSLLSWQATTDPIARSTSTTQPKKNLLSSLNLLETQIV